MVVLGWGYWHMMTHATLNLSVHDVSLKTDRQAYGRVVNANIVFMDAMGVVLAEGRMASRMVSFRSLVQIDDCSRYEQQASNNADARQSWQRALRHIALAGDLGQTSALCHVTMNALSHRETACFTGGVSRELVDLVGTPASHWGQAIHLFQSYPGVDGLHCRAASL